jgi:DNA-binding transcriptional LysR family regulator
VGQSDLDSAALFVQVVEHNGFRGAARALGLPKSTLSRRVADLEARLGARLLQRTTRKVGLTDAGEAYYRQARVAVAALQEAERAVSELQAEPRGTLRVSMPTDFGTGLAAMIVGEYLARHAEVRVIADISNRRVDLVREGFDAAVRAGHLDDSSLVAVRCAMTPVRVFASPAYLRRRGVPATPEDLAAHDCIVFGAATDATWMFAGARRPKAVRVRGRVAANQLRTVQELAEAGYGLAQLPGMMVSRGARLRAVLDEHRLPPRPLHVVYPSARHLSPKVRAFVDLMREWTFQAPGG